MNIISYLHAPMEAFDEALTEHGLNPGSFITVKKGHSTGGFYSIRFLCSCEKDHDLLQTTVPKENKKVMLNSIMDHGYQFTGKNFSLGTYRWGFVAPQCCSSCRGSMSEGAEC